MQNTISFNSEALTPPQPEFVHAGGNGTLTAAGTGQWVLNLGTITEGAIGQSAVLEIANMQDIGQGNFTLSGGHAFYLDGASSVTSTGPGGHDSVIVSAQTNTPGAHTALLTFHQTQPGSAGITDRIEVKDFIVAPQMHAGL